MFEDAPIPEKPVDLERLSVDELRDRIRLLQEEIEACNAELDRKRTHQSAADALFNGSD